LEHSHGTLGSEASAFSHRGKMTERIHRMKSVKCLVSGWDGEIMVSSYLPTIDSF
jgi:hypothetical protein